MLDDKPIMLDQPEEKNIGPIPFIFILNWIKQEGFEELVQEVWETPVSGSPFYVWE